MVKVDFGILTFLDVEFTAVLSRFPPEEKISGRRLYNISRFKTLDGTTYSVAVVRCLEAGMGEAIEAARDLIEDLSPSWLLVVGIAAGVPSWECSLGDVVISTQILDFIRERVLPEGEHSFELTGWPIHQVAARIVANLAALGAELNGWNVPPALSIPRPPVETSPDRMYGSPAWNEELRQSLEHHADRQPRMIMGTIASSDRIIRNEHIISALRARNRRILAVEMESAGISRVAMARGIPFLAIRGISELIGIQHDPRWQEYAAHAAAAFTLAFLRTRPIEPRQTTASRPPGSAATLAQGGSRSFHLKRLSLKAVRGFNEFQLALSPPQGEVGQWTLLLGPNGVGKTTILRALTLALCPSEVIQALLGRLGKSSPTVRIDNPVATILAEAPEGFLPRLTLAAGESGDRLESRGRGEVEAPFLVAYGCRRGSALGGAAREVNDASVLAAVETLFDEGASLIHAETWLKERQLAAMQAGADSKEARFFTAILDTIVKILPGVDKVAVSADAVTVSGPGVGRVPLGALSDGYLTTAGWVLDMVARWAEEARRRDVAVDGSFTERMVGIAIVDELDLHLHPRWQRDIISTIRGLFPRMSFFATTHNPLTLLGAREGEIHVLRREEDTGALTTVQCDLPPGLGAERILTGTWFDLPSTLDEGTLGLLEKHRQMLRADRADSAEAKELEQELRYRLGSYVDTSLERMAASAAARVLDEEAGTLTAERRASAHKKIVELLREERQGPKPRGGKRRPKSR